MFAQKPHTAAQSFLSFRDVSLSLSLTLFPHRLRAPRAENDSSNKEETSRDPPAVCLSAGPFAGASCNAIILNHRLMISTWMFSRWLQVLRRQMEKGQATMI